MRVGRVPHSFYIRPRVHVFHQKKPFVKLFAMTMTDAEWCTQSEGFRRASIDTQHAFEFALTATGGITGWQQRLTCRAATQASIERTFGPNWRELRAQCERQTRGPLNTRSDSDCIGREVLEYIGRVVSVDPLDGLLVNSTLPMLQATCCGGTTRMNGRGVWVVSVRGIFIISYVCSPNHTLYYKGLPGHTHMSAS